MRDCEPDLPAHPHRPRRRHRPDRRLDALPASQDAKSLPRHPAPATAPGVTGSRKAVDKAKDASATSDEANEKVQKATATSRRARPPPAPARSRTRRRIATGRELPLEPLTADATKGLPKPIVSALDKRQVFVRRRLRHQGAADDRDVQRRELAKADRYGGEVVVPAANVGKLASYNAIAGGAGVDADPDRRGRRPQRARPTAHRLRGRATRSTRRSWTRCAPPACCITDPYLRKLNDLRDAPAPRRFDVPSRRGPVEPALRARAPDDRIAALRLAEGAGQVLGRSSARSDVDAAKGDDFAVALLRRQLRRRWAPLTRR